MAADSPLRLESLQATRSWRSALLLARRDLRRNPRRTAAAAIMIFVPALLVAGLATALRTNDLGWTDIPEARLDGAPAYVEEVLDGPVDAQYGTGIIAAGAQPQAAVTDADVARRVGSDVLRVRPVDGLRLTGADDRLVRSNGLVTDWSDPLTSGLAVVLDGRLPTSPDEIALSPGLTEATGLGVGDEVELGGAALSVTGVAVERWANPALRTAFASELPAAAEATLIVGDEFGLLPSRPDVERANSQGLSVVVRGTVAGPDTGPASGDGLAFLAVLVALVILEVALLAGPAFAVGVRQQRQTLAVVVAGGGDGRSLRRAMLAQAVLIGTGAGVAGVVLGAGLVAAAVPLVRYRLPISSGPLDVPWLLLAGIVLVGTLAAVASALVPAIGAARDSLQTRVTPPVRPRLPLRATAAGVALLAVGSAIMVWQTEAARYDNAVGLAVGVLVLGIGMLLVTPLLVYGIGRLAPALPLAPRLAAREAVRARGRSVAAIAAVAGASAGLAAALTATTSMAAAEARDYVPQARPGVTTLDLDQESATDDTVAALVDAGAPADSVGLRSPSFVDIGVVTSDCPVPLTATAALCGTDWMVGSPNDVGPLVEVADVTSLDLTGYDLTSEQQAHLREGGVLVARGSALADAGASAELASRTFTVDGEPSGGIGDPAVLTTARVAVLTYEPRGPSQATMLVGEEAARQLGLWMPRQLLVAASVDPALAVDTAAAVNGAGLRSMTERGYVSTYPWIEVAVVAAAAFVVLVATFTATALALSDAGRDRTALTAVGATPRTRRGTAAATAGIIAGGGALLGSLVGLVPGAVLASEATRGASQVRAAASTGYTTLSVNAILPGIGTIVVPWLPLLGVVVVLPLVAAAVVWLVAPGRPDSEVTRLVARA